MKRSSLFVCLFLVLMLIWAGIPASAASPSVSGVSPGSYPNNGIYTITIHGTNLNTVTRVEMNKCKLKTGGSSEPPFSATRYSIKGPSEISATFDLRGKQVGDYDIRVSAPGLSGIEDWGVGDGIFHVYAGTGSTPTPTGTSGSGTTTTVKTYATSSEGDNSVFFDTSPSGATIILGGEEVGMSPFTYYTNRDGTYDVLVRKTGYEDYTSTVSIIRDKRVHFYAPLTFLSSTDTSPSGTGSSSSAGKTPATIRKSTLNLPTPLGTIEPLVQESPIGPATVLWAAALGMLVLVMRRR